VFILALILTFIIVNVTGDALILFIRAKLRSPPTCSSRLTCDDHAPRPTLNEIWRFSRSVGGSSIVRRREESQQPMLERMGLDDQEEHGRLEIDRIDAARRMENNDLDLGKGSGRDAVAEETDT
jgi:hypothetical protein